ncbi:lysozyme inhibitor LprI family protein [Pseudomonas sp. NPDC087598]|uniref:lysozyme inhibitor LprI family protein n=1 Tax=Pseudomonas sp. NPDC087598 TaxID=3364440 RepID=UPI0037F3F75B
MKHFNPNDLGVHLMKSCLFVLLTASIPHVWGAAIEQKACDVAGNSILQVTQCMEHLAVQKRAAVERLYADSLAKVPESSDDIRATRKQFEQEHAAWRTYVNEHCSFYGGVSEGASAWMSLAALRCELDELDARSFFLQNIPWNPERY